MHIVWKAATIFDSCLAFLLDDKIRTFACVSINVTSMSAAAALDVHLLGICCAEHVYCGYAKNCQNGFVKLRFSAAAEATPEPSLLPAVAPPPASCNRSFSASRDCKRCSNSFTNSIAPPTIEAWSPYTKIISILVLKYSIK